MYINTHREQLEKEVQSPDCPLEVRSRQTTGGEVGLRLARAHLQHVMEPLDLAGFFLCQEECKTVWGTHTGHTLTYRRDSWTLYQSVVFIRM